MFRLYIFLLLLGVMAMRIASCRRVLVFMHFFSNALRYIRISKNTNIKLRNESMDLRGILCHCEKITL